MKIHRDGDWLHSRIDKRWQGKPLASCLAEGFRLQESRFRQLFQEQKVWIGDSAIAWQDRDMVLQPGMRIRLPIVPENGYGIEPDYHPDVELVFEDEHCLVVNKPADMLVHPDRPGRRGTLDAVVAFHYLQQGVMIKPRHVHRLDKDTSGLVLYAKHAESHRLLDQQLANKHILRRYWAIIQGRLPKTKGTISLPIGRDRYYRQKRVISKSGLPAITRYQVIKTQDAPGIGSCKIIELQLETGRTHQIRVHLSHLGAPIAGDSLYGGAAVPLLPAGRQALHAYALQFDHPYTREPIFCEIEWPEDIKQAFQL
ncbi:RluA family pseudouridine synthase [Fodinisporobacter ferrooxydans]|uniref:Pseudouridine synthase n=1 Tax=Fodinisporobacter ferrooxydans TaxID=2901836 RepID=A0ABY4CE37_9BACL|nr:RluA family pseudouridine synthase [Alicyclobacillaceae bacterium MYW30-H2]